MTTKPTPNEVDAEILALNALVGKIIPSSIFGDDNNAKLAAQIKVIETNMPHDSIYDTWGVSENAEEDAESPELNDALAARRWLDGEWNEGVEYPYPSACWKVLVIK